MRRYFASLHQVGSLRRQSPATKSLRETREATLVNGTREPPGDWLSWLERCFHTAEVTGSNPVSPILFLGILPVLGGRGGSANFLLARRSWTFKIVGRRWRCQGNLGQKKIGAAVGAMLLGFGNRLMGGGANEFVAECAEQLAAINGMAIQALPNRS